VNWFGVRAHEVFPLIKANQATRSEAFGVSLTVGLSGFCIAAVTRLYGFEKLFEEVHFKNATARLRDMP
jgi:hypothetical protein